MITSCKGQRSLLCLDYSKEGEEYVKKTKLKNVVCSEDRHIRVIMRI